MFGDFWECAAEKSSKALQDHGWLVLHCIAVAKLGRGGYYDWLRLAVNRSLKSAALDVKGRCGGRF